MRLTGRDLGVERMRRFGVVVIGVAVTALLGISAAGAATPRRVAAPVVTSLLARPPRLPAPGGFVTLVAHVRGATTCTLGGGAKPITVGCARGTATGRVRVRANVSTRQRVNRLWVLARGRGGARRRFVAVIQAARAAAPKPPLPAPPSTTTTTTTTLPPAPATVCTGPCSFAFPQPTVSGAVSVAMNSVTQGVVCPDPGLCDATASEQIDDVNVTVCAGGTGDSDVSGQIYDFSLALGDGTQASSDSVSFDSSVPTAFGGYGAVAPNQCVTGDVYFDVPIGVSWTSLNYSYTSANFSTQAVYAWKA